MRRAAKVDQNHAEVVNAFRAMGCSVYSTHSVGGGFPDMVVGLAPDINLLIEVKDGTKPPSERTLTEAQVRFRDEWRGNYYVIESINDVIALVNRLRMFDRKKLLDVKLR